MTLKPLNKFACLQPAEILLVQIDIPPLVLTSICIGIPGTFVHESG